MSTTIKDDLLALLDSQDAHGRAFPTRRSRGSANWSRRSASSRRIRNRCTPSRGSRGAGKRRFAHFGGKHSAAKTRVHDSTLAMQSWNRFPPAPIRVLRICQEISRRGNAYNNVIDFAAPVGAASDGQAHGAIVVRGSFRDEPGNPQRFVVDFARMEIRPRGATERSAAARVALGLEADASRCRSADMKPPQLSSDVIYLDDELRINVGSLGGLYLLKRSDEAPVSL